MNVEDRGVRGVEIFVAGAGSGWSGGIFSCSSFPYFESLFENTLAKFARRSA